MKNFFNKSINILGKTISMKTIVATVTIVLFTAGGITTAAIIINDKKNNTVEANKEDTSEEQTVEEVIAEVKEEKEEKAIEEAENITVETDENGNTVIKDENGNVIADSSKGDDTSSLVEKRKSSGKTITETKGSVETNNSSISSSSTSSSSSSTSSSSGTSGSTSSGSTSSGGGTSSGGSTTTTPQTPPVEEVKHPTKAERTWEYCSQLSTDTFNAINNYRVQNGVQALPYSQEEQNKAQTRALYNVTNGDGGHEISQISQYNSNVGGNIAQCFVDVWSWSSGHKANMLDTENLSMGVAVYKDSGYWQDNSTFVNPCYYVVASFGW